MVYSKGNLKKKKSHTTGFYVPEKGRRHDNRKKEKAVLWDRTWPPHSTIGQLFFMMHTLKDSPSPLAT